MGGEGGSLDWSRAGYRPPWPHASDAVTRQRLRFLAVNPGTPLRSLARRGLAVAASVLALTAGTAAAAPEADTFTATGAMSAGAMNAAVAPLPNGTVLFAGGEQAGGGSGTTRAQVYDPTTGQWADTGSMVAAQSRAAVAVLADGRVLVTGGVDANGAQSTVTEIYDPATGQWASTGSPPDTQIGGHAVTLGNGKVLLVGFTGDPRSAWLYDPAGGQWTQSASLLGADVGDYSGAILLDNGRVLISSLADATAALYDPNTDSFTTSASMQTFPASYETLTTIAGGNVLLAGGDFSGVPTWSAEVYDPSQDLFMPVGSMAVARTRAMSATLPGGRAMVVGGAIDDGLFPHPSDTNTAEVFDPDTGTFSPAASMAVGRSETTAVTLWTGQVLVPSGQSWTDGPATTPASADLYTALQSAATLTPASSSFAPVAVDAAVPATNLFTLTNAGEATIGIGSAGPVLTGDGADQFRISASTCTAGARITPRGSCTVTVAFAPTRAGAATASLSVATSEGTHSATLSGTGTSSGGTSPAATPSNTFTMAPVAPGRGGTTSRITVPGPGVITQVGTRGAGGEMATRPACHASRTVMRAGTFVITCRMNAATTLARHRGAVRVCLTTTFTPAGGTPRSVTRTVVLSRLRNHAAVVTG